MTWPRLASVIIAAWALLTCGLVMAFDSWAVVPLSAGVALGAYAYPFARALYVASLAEKDEADR